MTSVAAALRSSVGKKYLMALSGLIWFGFAVGHLTGNYLILAGREAFDTYAQFLVTLGHGKGIYLAEFALVIVLITHVWNGIQVAFFDKKNARPQGYAVAGNAGGKSRKSFRSQSMIWTGLLLLGFIIFHILTLKFGPKEMHTLPHAFEQTEDLYGLVVKRFSEGWYVAVYVLAMTALGTHLSHGLWSSLQSLGLLNRRSYPAAATLGTVVAVVLALGFVALPLMVFTWNEKFAAGNGGLF